MWIFYILLLIRLIKYYSRKSMFYNNILNFVKRNIFYNFVLRRYNPALQNET